ncbi:thioester domain-containing protein [Actinomadura parmotrematis]|uniref:Thioester domain-containing protein n=1 Tax=Actinomadura parmotrematis TaxID=2864039 RepID=A0ABS7FNJ2_9ACTN|nr:thioester domain-containing protein [Actinomadura parmotrematis]MBW8481886.1 thioester domain-containing protein [Actinomadura parmotrematis]
MVVRGSRAARRPARLLAAVLALALTAAGTAPASAAPAPVPAPAPLRVPVPDTSVGAEPVFSSDVQITALGAGATVRTAYDAPAALNPLDGYPAALPAGSTPHGTLTARLIEVTDQGPGGATALTYCIDLHTSTQVGVNYKLGTWNSANVPNVGYVGYILGHYFPTTGEPAGLAGDNERAAAVQLAIWFLTDKLVLAPTDARYAAVAAIVTDALANGPSPEPSPPRIGVVPATAEAPSNGGLAGPFTVSGDGPATLQTVGGTQVFTDAAGRHRLDDGDTVRPGDRLWARSTTTATPQGFVLNRSADITESAVYLYDHTNPGVDDAQKLILAKKEHLTARAGVRLTRYDAGDLVLAKAVTGAAAGLQGAITLRVSCTGPDGGIVHHTRTLPAGASPGRHLLHVTGIPAGSTCTVTETATGENGRTDARRPVIVPSRVTVPTDGTVTVTVTDTYDRATGALRVTKAVRGDGAGLQGRITVRVRCTRPGAAPLTRTFHLSAHRKRGTYTVALLTGLPTGSRCTAAEPGTGANPAVTLEKLRVIPRAATIAKHHTSTIRITDTYRRKRVK